MSRRVERVSSAASAVVGGNQPARPGAKVRYALQAQSRPTNAMIMNTAEANLTDLLCFVRKAMMSTRQSMNRYTGMMQLTWYGQYSPSACPSR